MFKPSQISYMYYLICTCDVANFGAQLFCWGSYLHNTLWVTYIDVYIYIYTYIDVYIYIQRYIYTVVVYSIDTNIIWINNHFISLNVSIIARSRDPHSEARV